MSAISTDQVSGALAKVVVPKLGKSILDLDVVQDVAIENGHIKLLLNFNIAAYASKSQLRDWVIQAVENLPEVQSVSTEFIASKASPHASHQSRPGQSKSMITLPQVGCVLAVFSGKGGVGKSTVSANLAVAMTALGEKVGLFDADMHGPSIPQIMGIQDRPQMNEHKIIPLERHGVKTMSVGYLVKQDEPLIWRGPMISKGINEMLESAQWGALDFLILDLPPGTGDAQLGLSQDVRLDGAVAVTTPQDVALADVHRGIAAFQKLEVPIWGLIENMSYFVCPGCAERTEIFGSGGGEKGSLKHDIPLLGRLPLDPKLCQSSDAGTPLVALEPQHPASLEFMRIAEQIIETH